MAVRMELSRILIRELTDYQIIELREALDHDEAVGLDPFEGPLTDEARSFPIVIGLPEAQAIERRLKGVKISRPQTHDLLADVIRELGGTLEAISVHDLSDATFYAWLHVRTQDGVEHRIDARPSDAIALGVAQDVPIYVEEHVLEAATRDSNDEE